MSHIIDASKVAERMKADADRLSEIGEFLCGLLDKDKGAARAYARLLGIQSFMRLDAEEIETGQCSCRHVPDGDKEECQRCHDTGVSILVLEKTEPKA